MRFKKMSPSTYDTSDASQAPGYLARKFARVRKEQAEEAAKRKAETEAISVEQLVKVHALKGAAK